jgi:hypothetical protein
MSIYGFTIQDMKDLEKKALNSFAPPIYDDGAINIAAGGVFGTYVDIEGTVKTEAELVSRYREMALTPEVDKAVNEIVNESIVVEDDSDIVELVLDELGDGDSKLKDVLIQEFKYILDILEFKKYAYDIFKRWYIDGRSYYHVIINPEAVEEGIKELRYIDPRKMRKVRKVKKEKDPKTSALLQKTAEEFYIYSQKNFDSGTRGFMSDMGTKGLKISKDSIIHVTSGLLDKNNTTVLSYLHPAIRHLNMYKALEDATLIYHLSRATERRIFRIEIGNLPKHIGEQHVRDVMTRNKNKLQYNQTTGEIKDNRRFMTMIEDFYLPMRDGKGTDIDVLPGGTQLPQLLESTQYFQDRVYNALQVPLTRMKPDAIYNLGRATEITRDEVNFSKFIDRVRSKFSELLLEALGKQLIFKQFFMPEEWAEVKNKIKFKYARDNYFTELKESEIWNERFLRARDMDDFVGKYISADFVRRQILKMGDDEIQEQDALIAQEFQNPQFHPELMMPQEEQPQGQGQEQNGPQNKAA